MSQSRSQPKPEPGRVVVLPVGLPGNGRERRRAVLRPLLDGEHLRWLDLESTAGREVLLSQALALAIVSIGTVEDPSVEVLHRLTLCDRHALVHALLLAEGAREATVVPHCPTCDQRMELTLDLTQVRLPSLGGDSLTIERASDATVERHILRLPRPADAETAADGDALLARCLGLTVAEAAPWLDLAEQALADADPLGAIEVTGRCPVSGDALSGPYDLVADWLGRLREQALALLEEVHQLALRYHWSQDEILHLPLARRRAFLELCERYDPELQEVYAP